MRATFVFLAMLGLVSARAADRTLAPNVPAELSNFIAMLQNPNAACGVDQVSVQTLQSSTDYLGNDGTYDYKMNVCGPSNDAKCAGKGASMCQFDQGTSNLVASLGSFAGSPSNPPVWSYIDGKSDQGVQVQITDGDKCWMPGGQFITRTVNIAFPCTPGFKPGATFPISEDPSTCTFTAVIKTDASCPGGPGPSSSGGPGPGPNPDGGKKSGVSVGTIFLIVTLVVAVLYVVLGCVYQRKKNETTTMKESCPNHTFWFALPGLVKDGCKYTFHMIKSGCKSGTSQTYEEL